MKPNYVIISAGIFTDLTPGPRNILVHGYEEFEHTAIEKAKDIAKTDNVERIYYVIQHRRTLTVKLDPVIDQDWEVQDVPEYIPLSQDDLT